MAWSVLLREGEPWYTSLRTVFDALENQQTAYHFLLAGIETNRMELPCCQYGPEPVWISGTDLTRLVSDHKIQWIWGAFLGFPPEVTREEALSSTQALYAPGGADMDSWTLRNRFLETKAEFIIYADDSSFVEILSRKRELTEMFHAHKPLSEISEWNGP